jgi:hypothetical protein
VGVREKLGEKLMGSTHFVFSILITSFYRTNMFIIMKVTGNYYSRVCEETKEKIGFE